MGNYSKISNLAPGGKSLSLNNLGFLKKKSNYIGIVILVVILLVVAGLFYGDYSGKINLGIFPQKKDEN